MVPKWLTSSWYKEIGLASMLRGILNFIIVHMTRLYLMLFCKLTCSAMTVVFTLLLHILYSVNTSNGNITTAIPYCNTCKYAYRHYYCTNQQYLENSTSHQ